MYNMDLYVCFILYKVDLKSSVQVNMYQLFK